MGYLQCEDVRAGINTGIFVADVAEAIMAPVAPSAQKLPLYFVNAGIDYLLIGGISILCFLALGFFHSGERSDGVISLGIYLSWLVNWPHFSATSYRLYRSRASIAQYPLTALLVPVLILALSFASLTNPRTAGAAFVHLFMIWSPYHFSGQSIGISLIYAKRSGFQVGPGERLALSGFIYGTFLLQTIRSETGGDASFWGVSYPCLGLPQWVADLALVGLWAFAIAFAAFVLTWCGRQRRVVPPIVLLPAVSQFVWFAAPGRSASFNEFVPFFHSLQYLLIAWSIQLKEKLDETGTRPSLSYVLRETTRWGALNLAGGAFLFWALPELAIRAGYNAGVATAVLLAAVQIHHFFVDGVIWKLKNPRVASPLTSNLRDVLVAPALTLNTTP